MKNNDFNMQGKVIAIRWYLENLLSKFEIKKNINGYDLSFNLNDDLTNLGNNKEASINLNKVF